MTGEHKNFPALVCKTNNANSNARYVTASRSELPVP